MSAHTPGSCTCTISNRSGAHQYEGERWQRIEHCSLHAAAPELLEALEAIAHETWIEDRKTTDSIAVERVFRIARAAIAKAKP